MFTKDLDFLAEVKKVLGAEGVVFAEEWSRNGAFRA
jgi:hypothetical protein